MSNSMKGGIIIVRAFAAVTGKSHGGRLADTPISLVAG